MGRDEYRRFRVTVTAHEVAGRVRSFRVPAMSLVLYAPDERRARKRGVEVAYRDAALPAFKSLMRQSWPHVLAHGELEPLERLF